jgi:hypothetical protein
MSWQAMTAVSHHSGQANLEFRLLLRLAEYADPDGMVDPAPSRETMALWYNVTERTIRNRIKRLIDDGELEQVRVGSGPGRPSAYRVTLPMPDKALDIYPEKGEEFERAPSKGENTDQRVKILEEMMSSIFTLLQQMGERFDSIDATKGENNQRIDPERVKAKGEKGESFPEVERRRSVYDPNKNIYIYKDGNPEEIYTLITAMASVCKTPYWAETEGDYEDAAYLLFGWDAKPEQVAEFEAWWSQNGHYKGKPALKSLLGEWQNYRLGVTIVSSPDANGRNACPEAAAAWQEIKREVGNPGRPNFDDPLVLPAVQAVPGGWHRFKSNNYQFLDRDLREEFVNAYTRQQRTLSAA